MSDRQYRRVRLYGRVRPYLGYHEYLYYYPSNPPSLLKAIRRYVPETDSYYTKKTGPGEHELRIASRSGRGDVGIGTLAIPTAYPQWDCRTVKIGLKDFEAPYQLINRMTFDLVLNSRKKECCMCMDKMRMPHRKYFIVEDRVRWDDLREQMKFGFVRLFFCGRDIRGKYHELEIRGLTLTDLNYEGGVWKLADSRMSRYEFVWRTGLTVKLLPVVLSRLDRYRGYWVLGLE
jgi:hypothetical protein